MFWGKAIFEGPNNHIVHALHEIPGWVGWMPFAAMAAGFALSYAYYIHAPWLPDATARAFRPLYLFLLNKWYFDELYDFLFVRPVMLISSLISNLDKKGIDRLINGLARGVRVVAVIDDWFDRLFIDGLVNFTAAWTYATGQSLRRVQTGNLRQYVLFIVVGTVALLFVIRWSMAWAAG
jgi:NADH:ubiquinone oxidoreductase subunit 5 (subunit L)/multisubunit Na+/H+ antiporter MnhA subunit